MHIVTTRQIGMLERGFICAARLDNHAQSCKIQCYISNALVVEEIGTERECYVLGISK